MRISILLATACSSLAWVACDSKRLVDDSPNLSTPDADSSLAVKESGHASELPSDVTKMHPPGKTIPGKMTLLKVTLEASEIKQPRGFILKFHAIPDGPEYRRISLGEIAIYKPLQESEQTDAYLPAPPKEAWCIENGSPALNVGFEVLSGNAKSPPPQLRLRIVGYEFIESNK